MRVCYVNTTATGRNGITAVAFGYINELLELAPDCTIDYVSINEPEGNYREIIESHGGKFYVFRRLSHPLSYLLKLTRALKGCDILHIHGNSATMLLELMAAFFAGVPVRISHGHATGCSFRLLDKLCRPLFYLLTTHTLACGEKSGQWLFGERDCEIFGNVLKSECFAYSEALRAETRKALGIGEELVLINIANFEPPKNHTFLLESFKGVKAIIPEAKLLLAGNGPGFDAAKSFCSDNNLEENVIFLGSVNSTRQYLCAADLFLLPSIREGVPITILEAQCAGLPCLMSDTVSTEVVFTENVNLLPLDTDVWINAAAAFNPRVRSETVITPPNRYDISQEAERLYCFYKTALK